ncbi:c-type cytochrome biogenesis protein CcsB [Lipingzhangella sp. LS1_29]|uniref:C-type cytochrome biogenesis protein CcsB n=2 Tax=Lipingzhangella rawalii TaxID=2055835 RepID=A0ABU2HA49_9ACTN|nr:c-type cytochrome biogenesis protein CcsB [Lipingzhangella rawalii]MDS1271734.1 c-type cytochrome biogenesis protein CcsB [Lipingzhangella rawalii]
MVLAMIVAYAVGLLLFAVEAAYGQRTTLRSRTPATVGGSGTSEGGGDEPDDLEVRLRETPSQVKAPRHWVGTLGLVVVGLGLVCNLLQIVARGLAAERWPWGNMFEFVVAICFGAVAAFLYVALRHQARFLGVFVLVPVLILLGVAARWLYNEAGPLIPALDSYWIAIHVSAAIVATGAFMVAGSTTIAYLLAHRAELRRAAGEVVTGVAGQLPSSQVLDRLAHGLIVFAFPLWTFSIIAGAIWADEAWGRFWGWDPKEVWSFITWIIYAAYLHARATAGWRGPRSAWISLAGFACLLFNFFAVNYLFSGLHSYA